MFAFTGHWEIILIILVVLLLFGARRIPELMRGLGSGLREFQRGRRGDADEPPPERVEGGTETREREP